MAEEKEEIIDLIESGSVRLKSILGAAGVIVAAIATGAMEFRDIRNDITDLREDKITAVVDKYDRLKELVENNYAEFKAYRSDTSQSVRDTGVEHNKDKERIIEDIRTIQSTIAEMENNASRLRLSITQLDSNTNKNFENYNKSIEGLNEKVSKIKDDVLQLLLKKGK